MTNNITVEASRLDYVIPAKAGIQRYYCHSSESWNPGVAGRGFPIKLGMTNNNKQAGRLYEPDGQPRTNARRDALPIRDC